jgi:hypothetical protein
MATVTRYINTASSGGDGTTNGESGATAAYASMSAWEAAEQKNLTTASEQHVVNCSVGSGSAADTTAVIVTGWTTDSGDYITIQANASQSQRAVMPWSTSIYRLSASSSLNVAALDIEESYTRVINLQVELTMTGGTSQNGYGLGIGLSTSTTNCLFVSSFMRCFYTNALDGVGGGTNAVFVSNSNANGSNTFRNCVGHTDTTGAGDGRTMQCFGFWGTGAGTVAQNCTAYVDCGATSKTTAFRNLTANSTTYTNCLGHSKNTGAGTEDAWLGTANAASDYNAATDATTTGANSRDSQTFTFAAGGDYHITSADAGARNYGDDLSGTFSDDFDGNTRPNTGGSWDIGAHEEQTSDVVAAGAYYQQYYRSVVTT